MKKEDAQSEAKPLTAVEMQRGVKRPIAIAVKTARARNKHIERLQQRNRELAEALAEERIRRKQAWHYYQKRLNSRFLFLMDWVSHVALKDKGV
jgi:hypothetical protein